MAVSAFEEIVVTLDLVWNPKLPMFLFAEEEYYFLGEDYEENTAIYSNEYPVTVSFKVKKKELENGTCYIPLHWDIIQPDWASYCILSSGVQRILESRIS